VSTSLGASSLEKTPSGSGSVCPAGKSLHTASSRVSFSNWASVKPSCVKTFRDVSGTMGESRMAQMRVAWAQHRRPLGQKNVNLRRNYWSSLKTLNPKPSVKNSCICVEITSQTPYTPPPGEGCTSYGTELSNFAPRGCPRGRAKIEWSN
jgi:hypothetical protein